jgi:TolB-like protein/Flp pilus assembly protein TadD
MSDIFISYARSTETQAQQIAEALRALGYGVWRDDELPAHRSYSDVIEERLKAAKAVVVVWSADAVKSEWVRSEADRGRADHKLVQMALDSTPLPMPFDQIHCADLTGWSGDPQALPWRTVLASIEELAGGQEPTKAIISNLHLAAFGEPGGRPEMPPPIRPSIAVLPFKNVGGRDREYIADAISEEIVTALSRWRWFFVIARHSSFTYKGQEIAADRIGSELGVRYLLQGSVHVARSRIRVTAQLVDAASGASVWANRFDRELVDVLALQDEIAREVAGAIEPAMIESEGSRLARKSTRDFTALDCFYRGMWRLNRMSEQEDEKARLLFQDAIDRDPDLSLAYTGLSRALYGLAIYGTSHPTASFAAARTAAQKAISLDAQDACAYFASSGSELYLGRHELALDDARKAIDLNPNYAYAYYRLGQVLLFSGEPAAAIEPLQRSLRLSPYDPQLGPMLQTVALAYYQARDYETAAKVAAAADKAPGGGSTVLAASLARLGRATEANAAFRRAQELRRSTARPLAAPYSDPRFRAHFRKGFRLAGEGVSPTPTDVDRPDTGSSTEP